jgi:hypothetical protein
LWHTNFENLFSKTYNVEHNVECVEVLPLAEQGVATIGFRWLNVWTLPGGRSLSDSQLPLGSEEPSKLVRQWDRLDLLGVAPAEDYRSARTLLLDDSTPADIRDAAFVISGHPPPKFAPHRRRSQAAGQRVAKIVLCVIDTADPDVSKWAVLLVPEWVSFSGTQPGDTRRPICRWQLHLG